MPLTNDTNGNIAQVGRLGPSQTPAITLSSTQSAATTDPRCYAVRVVATVDCYVAIAANPTATATSTYLVAFQPEYFGAKQGDKVAMLGVSAAGTINITEVI